MGEVVNLPSTPEGRASVVRAYLTKQEPPLRIETLREAIAWGDRWQAHAMRLEALLALVTAQRDASDLLLRIAEDELARLKGIE